MGLQPSSSRVWVLVAAMSRPKTPKSIADVADDTLRSTEILHRITTAVHDFLGTLDR